MEQGWDPEVKKFFIRILNTISLGLLWMMIMLTTGFYFRLAYFSTRPVILPVIYYLLLTITLAWLLRKFYRMWK